MNGAKQQPKASKRQFPLKTAGVLLLLLLVAIAGCYYVISNGGTEAYTYQTLPSPNVDLSISINYNTTGRGALTLLNSVDKMITLKVASKSSANSGFWMLRENELLRADLRINWISNDYGTLVYLPAGPSYNVTINCRDFASVKSGTVNKYTGGNLTLWVNDTVHGLYRYSGST